MKCHLCYREKKWQESHIIPEFFYRPIYDHKHRVFIFSPEPTDKTKYEQKGIREKLLCWDCEQILNQYETYARELFYGKHEIQISEDSEKYILGNIDYRKFKLFQMSLLWRMSISTKRYFSEVDIGVHNNIISNLLFAGNPGKSYNYGCLMTVCLIEIKDIKPEVIATPFSTRIDNHKCYVFLLGGCSWVFIVSNHAQSFPHKEAFLKEDGDLKIYKGNAKNERVEKLTQEIKLGGKSFLIA